MMGSIPADVNLPGSKSTDPCMRLLGTIDPCEEKARIEAGKDKLQKGCYLWILDSPNFQRWRDSDGSRLLWINGDPGKGKTMTMIALTEELQRQSTARSRSTGFSQTMGKSKTELKPCIVSYFFCQGTDSRLNNVASVLKGLIYLLVAQERSLVRHVRKRYNDGISRVYEGPNAVCLLRAILQDALNDSVLPRTYLLVDALDECSAGSMMAWQLPHTVPALILAASRCMAETSLVQMPAPNP